MTELALERIDPEQAFWDRTDAFPGREVFQLRAWTDFVARTQPAQPCIAEVRSAGDLVGYFTGLTIRKFGVRILGSPFPGWTTPTMGFTLTDGVSRRAAMAALRPFAFHELGCHHIELRDRRLRDEHLTDSPWEWTHQTSFEVDLRPREEEVFWAMKSACRRAVRKGVREGVVVEEAHGEDFAAEYYAQLEDVFAKQDRKPLYDERRVRELIRCLEPTGHLLLLRARAPDGSSAATAIFPGLGSTAYFWGGASWRSHQHLRPNEALFWYAMRTWRERGATTLELGGGGDYKRKFGPTESYFASARTSRIPGLMTLRNSARRIVAPRAAGG